MDFKNLSMEEATFYSDCHGPVLMEAKPGPLFNQLVAEGRKELEGMTKEERCEKLRAMAMIGIKEED